MFNVIVTGLTSLLTDISSEMVYPLIPIYLATLGAQPAILGLIEGFAESSASILKVFSGIISDRARRRKPLAVLGYTGSTIGKLLLYLSQNWGLVFAGRMVDRIGKGLRVTPRDALIADCTTPDRRGGAFGLHRSMDTIGAVIGVLTALYLTSRLGSNPTRAEFQRIFLISLIPAFLGIVILLFARENKIESYTKTQYRLTFKNLPPKLRNFLIIIGLFTLGNSSNGFLLLRMKNIGWTTIAVLLLYLVYNLTYSIFSYPAGKLSDKIGRKRLLVAGYGLYGIVYFGIAFIKPESISILPYILFAIYGLYSALTEGQERALMADLAPEKQRATFIGIHATLTGIGLLPASLIAGGLWSLFGPRMPFFWGGALGLAAALGLAIFI
ncbi:MAG: MFS transporter [bacterium]